MKTTSEQARLQIWNPMETVPKDGSTVLVLTERGTGRTGKAPKDGNLEYRIECGEFWANGVTIIGGKFGFDITSDTLKGWLPVEELLALKAETLSGRPA